jgi:hypothetical protein
MTREMMSNSNAPRRIDTASPADLQMRFASQQGPQDPHSHQSASISKARVDPEEGQWLQATDYRYERRFVFVPQASSLKSQAFLKKDKIRN